MEVAFRVGLLLIAVTIFGLMLWERRNRSKITQRKNAKKDPDIIALRVLAKNDMRFASYELLQCILSTGLKFGDMNIFHYYVKNNQKNPLFSLASATEPGEFDLDRMGTFSCKGLTLFFDLSTSFDPKLAFKLMMETAQQLAEDLDGEIRAMNNSFFTKELSTEYQQRVTQYQLAYEKA